MGAARTARVVFWALLILSWAGMVWLAFSALTTIPSAERLQESRMARIPTPAGFARLVTYSLVELAVVLALLWPWQARRYVTRMAAAFVLLAGWFLMTTPLALTSMDWVHRRWLALVCVALLLALFFVIAGRLLRSTPPNGHRGSS